MRSVAFALVLTLAWNANADVPACTGDNPVAAGEALRRGKEFFADAFETKTLSDAERKAKLEQALSEVDAACRDGEIGGLRRRATILVSLHRWIEAAQSVDAYVKLAGDRKLEADEQLKFDKVRKQIEPHVATLHVLAAPAARIDLDANLVSTGPTDLRIDDAPHKIGVEGQEREVVVKLGEAQDVDLRPPSVADPTPVAKEQDHVVAVQQSPHLVPWIIASGVATGAFFGAAIGGALWADDRARTYNAFQCGGSTPPTGCTSVQNEYNAARGFEVAMFVAMGLAAVTTGILIYVQLQKPHPKPKAWACGIAPNGLACSGSF